MNSEHGEDGDFCTTCEDSWKQRPEQAGHVHPGQSRQGIAIGDARASLHSRA